MIIVPIREQERRVDIMNIENLIKVDKRKNYYLIIDTETAGEKEGGDIIKHIYDIRLLYSK